MRLFDAVDSLKDDSRVPWIDSTITVEVVHDPVAIVVDIYIGRITVHVTAETGSAAGVPAAGVV